MVEFDKIPKLEEKILSQLTEEQLKWLRITMQNVNEFKDQINSEFSTEEEKEYYKNIYN